MARHKQSDESNRRKQELTAAVERFADVHQSWLDSIPEAQPVEEVAAGQRKPGPEVHLTPIAYLQAAEELVFAWDAGAIPAEFMPALSAVEGFAQAVCNAWERANGKTSLILPPGFEGAWNAMQRAFDGTRDHSDLPPLESMADLRKQGVTDPQIVLIYGLSPVEDCDVARSYVHLVQKEINEPGSVINASWVDPRIKDRQQRKEQDRRNWSRGVTLSACANALRARREELVANG